MSLLSVSFDCSEIFPYRSHHSLGALLLSRPHRQRNARTPSLLHPRKVRTACCGHRGQETGPVTSCFCFLLRNTSFWCQQDGWGINSYRFQPQRCRAGGQCSSGCPLAHGGPWQPGTVLSPADCRGMPGMVSPWDSDQPF